MTLPCPDIVLVLMLSNDIHWSVTRAYWHHKSTVPVLFVQQLVPVDSKKTTIKAQLAGPLWGESTGELYVSMLWWLESAIIGECGVGMLLLKPYQHGHHFTDDIFQCVFLNENIWISIKISLNFVPKGRINNIPALVQIITVGELRSTLCTKTPLYVRSGLYIKQMPLEYLSYIKEMSWNTLGCTWIGTEFTHNDNGLSLTRRQAII